ncbi:hypothetical protein [Rhizobium esperanzae]|uniref:Uncharacterized protein n=1 Tax=Rhizobium esperanzae TaxID=1967781 RepID=A0A7W6R1E9_9HYPH|nr:hypothetical protein [Rhizobium esperanzae]MBB4235081.1 hypothetical protein [Rhizobium esperanzae]
MTLNEFKAWLEGFETAMGGNPPSAEQWAAIKAKLAKVEVIRPTANRDVLPRGWNDGIRMEIENPPIVARYR